MALVNIQQSWSDDTASSEQIAGSGNTADFSVLSWTVEMSDVADDPNDARDAAGIPAIGDAHATETDQKVIRKRATKLGPYMYEVVVEYAGETSPLLAPYARSWSQAHSVEPIDEDKNGDSLLTIVGERFAGLTKDRSDSVYVVTRNEGVFPEATARTYQDSINTLAFHGFQAGECRMVDINGTRVVDGASWYWRVTYKIQCRRGGWALSVLNEGTRRFDEAGDTDHAPVLDRDGLPLSGKARLAADGTQLLPNDASVFLDFDLYEEQNFNLLNLG